MDFGDIYKWAGALRMPVGPMSLFEFLCAIRGYAESKGVKQKGGSISDERLEEMGIVGF